MLAKHLLTNRSRQHSESRERTHQKRAIKQNFYRLNKTKKARNKREVHDTTRGDKKQNQKYKHKSRSFIISCLAKSGNFGAALLDEAVSRDNPESIIKCSFNSFMFVNCWAVYHVVMVQKVFFMCCSWKGEKSAAGDEGEAQESKSDDDDPLRVLRN